MSKTDVVMPQMGESIAEGTIVRWLKKVGDLVERDEPLFEISTDKVDAEIPSPTAGVLVAIQVPEGAVALVHSVVAEIESAASDAGGPAVSAALAQAADVHVERAAGRALTVPAADGRTAQGGAVSTGPHRASPVARRIARDRNVDLRSLSGSGGSGRITKQDVLLHLEGAAAAPSRPSPPPASAPPGPSPGDVVPMTTMRRKIAEHMIASRRTSAHVYSVFEVDCSRVDSFRRARRAEFEAAGAKLSILPLVLKAAALALREWPLVNASLDGDRVVHHGDVNVGFAVALENGLIVPVIRNADRRTLKEISLAIGDLARRARARQLKPEEVAGGTFTVTNPGNFGGAFATPIINQPQVAILELGTVEKRVAVVNDALAIRPMMHLTLGFDHRLIDGAAADQFLSSVKRALETWDDRS